ncbi:Xyloglucan galactosyltransferase KATAMARI1-like protein [Dichanthelium oligosanthes]|uniref:Xyloglucan galactosyltransferase KATAMARI1-like protein n=1 Tax=Dichanthelium oligosanthes TaxID=888268 RepID=A0A1E5VZ16_9POAL|nr:Xyloglucan galactosyltransferase KATAMARI1-like protein [Dichanthelium oligosanthes]
METNYPKYFLYGLLFLGSWLLTFLLHFHQFFHLFGDGTLAVLQFSLNTSFFPASAVADNLRSTSLSSCDGRYVHMLDLPPRFDVCVQGSPAFDSKRSICPLMSNAGLGEVLSLAGNESDGGDTDVVPNTGWYNTNQYALEVIFHNRMRQYECLTDDPAAATAVYVPYYPALELHPHLCGAFNTTSRNGASEEFLRWLSSRPPWAALGGRDHFMVASKTTWMFRRVEAAGRDDEGCGNSFLEQPESRNMTVLTYETGIWERPRRGYFPVPYPSYFHPSSAGEVAAWQARVRAAPRPWMFAFAGARRPNGTLAIRDRIFDACDAARRRSRRCGMLDCGDGNCQSSPRKLVSLFASSRFCLQPPGDSFMRRSSVDAVMAGCIPVFFHEASTFEKQYRWHERGPNSDGERRYYVFVDQDEVLQGTVDIEEVLSRYDDDDEVATMRDEVIKMIPRFLYKDPRVSFKGEMSDAVDIAMDEVLARMRRIKNGKVL